MFEVENKYKNANVSRTIRFTESLFEQLNDIVVENDISFNLLVLQCCQYALNNIKKNLVQKIMRKMIGVRNKDRRHYINEVINIKVAVIGSRCLNVCNIGEHLPDGATEIISGGAQGIDTCARDYALANGIKLTEILPEYNKFGRAAPLRRNDLIINNADIVLAFWNGQSRGTKYVIDLCKDIGKPVVVLDFRKATANI